MQTITIVDCLKPKSLWWGGVFHEVSIAYKWETTRNTFA